MIDVMAEGIVSHIQQRLNTLFPFVLACRTGCLGLGACAAIIALFAPSFPGVWIMASVCISAAASGYTFSQKRRTKTGPLFWALALACGPVLAGLAWKLLNAVQAATFLTVLSNELILGLFAFSLLGALAGGVLRLRFEKIVNNPETISGDP